MNPSKLTSKFSANTLLALKNMNWMLFEKIVSIPLSLILSIVFARYLGTEGYGQYSYYMALTMLVVPIAALGLNAIVTRELVQTPDASKSIMGTSLFGRLMGSTLGVIGLCVYAFFYEVEQFYIIMFLAFCQVFSAFTVFNFWFQAKQLNKLAVIARLLAMFLGFGIKLTIVWLDLGLNKLVIAFGLDFLLVAFFLLYFYRSYTPNTALPVEFDYLKKLLAQSKWLILSSVAAAINLKIDLIMLANLSSDAEVGLYAVAARISEVWYFIPITITAAFFPLLLKAREANEDDYKSKLQNLNDALFALSLAVVVPVILLSEFFISLLFGEPYRSSAAILNIHILGGIFIFMRALLSKWLIAENLLKFSLMSHGFGAIVNIIANYLFIPQYGGMGAAIASLLSYIMSSYLVLFISSKTRPMAIMMTFSLIYPLRFLKK